MSTKVIQVIYCILGIIAAFAIGFKNIVDNKDLKPLLYVALAWFLLYAIIRPLCIIARHHEKVDECVSEDKLMNFLKSKLF